MSDICSTGVEVKLMNSTVSFLVSLASGSLRLSIPVAFAAIGGTLCERSGIVNMGLEGIMISGAFAGAYGSYISGSAWVGLLFAMGVGIVLGLAHALLTVWFKCEHVLAGLGINMFADGMTIVLLQYVWGSKGKSSPVAGLGMWEIPIINRIPILSDIIGRVSPLFVLLLVSMVLMHFMLFKTTFGLRCRVTGENPYCAAAVGIDVYKHQFISEMLGGMFAAIGGAYLSIGDVGLFSKNMTAGRGFIAVAIVILGGWKPTGAVLGAIVFGAAQSLQIRLQAAEVPAQLIQMLPYVITILTLLVMRLLKKRSMAPAAEGQHYYREGQ